MKTLIICLILFIGYVLPDSAHGNSYTISTMKNAKSGTEITSFHHDANPRKKVKKKRKTILNRKVKMRNGHSCPSF